MLEKRLEKGHSPNKSRTHCHSKANDASEEIFRLDEMAGDIGVGE
jgi:hypothetical protein